MQIYIGSGQNLQGVHTSTEIEDYLHVCLVSVVKQGLSLSYDVVKKSRKLYIQLSQYSSTYIGPLRLFLERL